METTTASVKFTIAGDTVEAQVTVPTGPTSTRTLLPFFRAVAEAVVDRGVRQAGVGGAQVSPAKASNAVTRIEEGSGGRFIPWVPLILAPEWSRSNPEPLPKLMGPELLQRFFATLAEPAQPL